MHPLQEEVPKDTGPGLVNSQTAKVAAVDVGKFTFRLEGGRMLDVAPGDLQLRHIDRAWASTVHAFQGRTVDTVIDAMEANHPHITTRKTLYFEISRARDRAERVTDNKAAFRKQLEAVAGERIAVLGGVEPDTGKAVSVRRWRSGKLRIGGKRRSSRLGMSRRKLTSRRASNAISTCRTAAR